MKDVALERKQISFRLREDIIEKLKIFAKEENRTLNNFVETLFLDYVYNTPNEETLKSMKETEQGIGVSEVDMSSEEAMWKSLGLYEKED